LKKEQKTVSLQKIQNNGFKKDTRVGFKKNGFFSTLTIFQSFFMIFPWSHDLEQVASLSVK